MPLRLTRLVVPLAWICLGSLGWAEPNHPRIFLTAKDLAAVQSRAADTRACPLGYVPAEAWKRILDRADAFVVGAPYHREVMLPGREGGPGKHWEYTFSAEPPPRHDDYPHYPPWTAMFQEGSDSITSRIECLTLAYKVTGRPQYLVAAKRIVFALCAWPGIWTDPSYGGGKPCLDTGHAAAWVAVFYDWCYDALSEAERTTVRRALVEKALTPIDQHLDRVPAYHNFTAVTARGLCLGGIALLGDEPQARRWIDHAVARALLNFDCQGHDGGAMEGPGYGTYATDSFASMIWALTTAGIPNRLVEHNYIKTLPRYCISLLNASTHQQPCFGDGGPTAGFATIMLSLALRGDSDAAWYCAQIGGLTPHRPTDFVLLDPSRIHPRLPTFNPSACFVDIGYAILRDGYRGSSAFLAMKCGPPDAVIGHNHFDHNSFVINYAGTWLAWDPGYRSYFNPPERRYSTSTLGHNSVVLDLNRDYLLATTDSVSGHDQVTLNRGRIREFFTSNDFDYVLGDAAETYNGKARRVLDRFDRQIVFAKPNVFFIRDTLAAPEEHAYSFLLHLPAMGQFEICGRAAHAIVFPCLLETHVFSPAGITLTSALYPGATQRGAYLAATTARRKATTITSVLVARRQRQLIHNPGFERGMEGWQPRTAPGSIENHVIDHAVKHGGDASARIDQQGYYYTQHFQVPVGTRLVARWWAKCTVARGASSCFFYWKEGKAFASKNGPVANVDRWHSYELTDTVPQGTEDVCLALQFCGKGQCWYDDVEITTNPDLPETRPAQVLSLREGQAGAVAVVDGITHILICGRAGESRLVEAAGHKIRTDAEMALISMGHEGPKTFLLRGTAIRMDDVALTPAAGEWRLKAGSNAEAR